MSLLQARAPGGLLEDRWRGLHHEQVRHVCGASTMVEALLRALPLLWEGTLVRTHEWSAGFIDVGFIETSSDGGRLVVLTCPPGVERGWQADPRLLGRVDLFAAELRTATTTSTTATVIDLLAMPDPHPWSALALDYWWEQRMRESHTPETAHFMLSLVAHPSLVGAVTVDPATGLPHLMGVSDSQPQQYLPKRYAGLL